MSEIDFSGLKSYDGTVSEAEFNRLVDICSRLVLNNGVNYRVKRSVAGTVIVPGGVASLGTVCPFAVSVVPVAADPTTLTATITVGTVNQFVPTNAFDSFTIDATGTYYVKASIESDGQKITSVEYNVDTSIPDNQTPTPFSLPTSFDILLAIVYNGRVYRTIDCGSVSLSGQEQFRVDKTSADPGSLPYSAYYVWVIQ